MALIDQATPEFYQALPATAQLLLRQVECEAERLEDPVELRHALLEAWIGWMGERYAIREAVLPMRVKLELEAPTSFMPLAAVARG